MRVPFITAAELCQFLLQPERAAWYPRAAFSTSDSAPGFVDSSVDGVTGGGCLLGNSLYIPGRLWVAASAQRGVKWGLLSVL